MHRTEYMRKLPTVLAAMRDDLISRLRGKTGTLRTNQLDQLIIRTQRCPQAPWYAQDHSIFTIEYRDGKGNAAYGIAPGSEVLVVHHRRIVNRCFQVELANEDALKALHHLIDDSAAPKPRLPSPQ
jgi:hypothetical protein